MTKIGEVPYFGQFMFYLKAPGKNLTGDHQNTVDPCYGQYEFAGGLPPTQNPYFGQFGASPPPLSPIMVNIVLLASINPYYGQFIINWWLWGHYAAPFTICRPCYGQFIITWVLQCLYKATCVLIIPDNANLSSLGDFNSNIRCILHRALLWI